MAALAARFAGARRVVKAARLEREVARLGDLGAAEAVRRAHDDVSIVLAEL